MNFIHPTAVIAAHAHLADDIHVGPFSVLEDQVRIGASTHIGSHVLVRPFTTVGEKCQVFTGAVLGEVPQDLKFAGEETSLKIGDHTTIREYVTINRGTAASGSTVVGRQCLLLAYVHVAHDCRIEDHVILSNAVNLAGHVHIEPHAAVGGMVPVHQHVRIGRHAFVGGGYRVAQDVPPYILAAGEPLGFKGLNYVGLRRCGLTAEAIKALEAAYRLIYRSGLRLTAAITRIDEECPPLEEIAHVKRFVESSVRGILR